MADISRITVNGVTYDLKDTTARGLIGTGKFVVSTNAATTPAGVSWYDTITHTTITGTLAASASIAVYIYLVPEAQDETEVKSDYSEYVVITADSGVTYTWEKLGSTSISLTGVVTDVAFSKATDSVLGAGTTVTVPSHSVSFGTPGSATFVQSYPGTTSKLDKVTITGTNGTVSVSQVSEAVVTSTNTVFGTDTSASKITTASKTATNLVLGSNTTASKAAAGTAYNPITGYSTTSIYGLPSAIADTNSAGVVYNMHVTDETLSFSTTATTTTSNAVHTPSTTAITPYTFTDITVPVITSNTSLTFNAVSTNTDVVVPVVSSNASVTASKVTITNVNAAVVAGSATSVATGTLSAGGTGDVVMTGLGTATTAAALTSLPTATVAQQGATVGTNDLVTALTDGTTVTVTKHS